MPDDNALHIAAKEGDLVEVQSQVSNFDINAKGEDDGTALYWSARNGHAEVVKLLLTLNVDVNIPNVSTLKMISVQLKCIPLSYDHYFMPYLILSVITLSRYYPLQIMISNVTSHRHLSNDHFFFALSLQPM